MDARINASLASILNQFKSGDIPSAKWSLLNRTLMFIGGTSDARGFRQWAEAGRHVKKGEKSRIFILVSFFKKRKDEEADENAKLLKVSNPAAGRGLMVGRNFP